MSTITNNSRGLSFKNMHDSYVQQNKYNLCIIISENKYIKIP